MRESKFWGMKRASESASHRCKSHLGYKDPPLKAAMMVGRPALYYGADWDFKRERRARESNRSVLILEMWNGRNLGSL